MKAVGKTVYKERVDEAAKIAKERGRIHYTALAYMLGIGPNLAIMVAKAVAETWPQDYAYEDGYLIYRGGH